jgi:hypothetical protein
VRLKTPLKVVDEIQYLGEECGVPQFFFTDPVFNYPLEHAKEICQEMIRRKLKIRWSAYHNVENFDAEYVRLARAAGCVEFYFSPDSATEQGLKFLRKGATTESLHRALDIISRQKGANTAFNFFAYVPSTGWKNFLAGIMFIARARLKLGKRLTRWKFSYIRLQPQTALTKILNGKDVNPDDCFPSNYRSLNALYLKHSPSIILNLILWLHYNLGRIFGSKNLLKELPPETI